MEPVVSACLFIQIPLVAISTHFRQQLVRDGDSSFDVEMTGPLSAWGTAFHELHGAVVEL